MNWQIFVSLRYLTTKRREKFISIVSLISILGVAVGVAALIVVIAVMSGFDNDLKDKITGSSSHLVIETEYGMTLDKEILSEVLNTEHVVSASFFVSGQALLRHNNSVGGIILKGIDPSGETRVNKIGQYMVEGSLDFGRDGIVVGSELANRFRLKIGDRLMIISAAYREGRSLKVCGIFTSGMYEYDANFAYMSIAGAQELFGMNGVVSGIAVKIDDAMKALDVKRVLQKELGFPYVVRTWIDLNKNLLEALKLEKTVMFIILTLIVMVACFNITGALIMTVLEKTKDIGILKAIGASNIGVMGIFMLQGCVVGILGTALGASAGVLTCWALKTYKFITLPRDVYYIDRLPVNVQPQDVILIVASAIILSLFATIYPSYRASHLDPVEALRYE